MSLLQEIIKEYTETLVEASFEDVMRTVSSRIASTVGSNEPDSKPTGAWLAGLLTGLESGYSKPLRLVSALNAGRLDPESKEYRDAARTKVALDAVAETGLITKSGGTYAAPSRGNRNGRDNLSKFKQFLSSYVHTNRDNADITKQFRQGEDAGDREWVASLSPEDQQLVKIYSELTPTDLAMLKRIAGLKKEKRSYVDTVTQAELAGSPSIDKLKSVGLLTGDNSLNSGLVKRLKVFLAGEGNFARLRNLNKDIRSTNKRVTSDQAYARNELEKKMDMSSKRQTEVSRKVGNIINSLSDAEKKLIRAAYRNGKLPKDAVQSLQKIGILDNAGEFTERGKAVGAVLNVRTDIDSFSSTAVDNATEPGFKSERRKERLQDRKRNFARQTGLDN